MKVNDTRAAAPQTGKASGPDAPKKSNFSKVLEKKSDKGEEPQMQPLPALAQRQAEATAEAAPTRATASVRDIDNLAHEITVAVRDGGTKEVEIQMDSKTFEGLNIRITKQDGKLSVRLLSESADVKRLLASQTEALTQRLEARGYAGAVVQVQSPAATSFSESRGSSADQREQGSQGEGSQGGGRQQGGRGRQR